MNEKEKTETQKDNYERLIFAIAVLFADSIELDTTKVDSYDGLSEGQKIFAKKIFDKYPSLEKQVQKNERLSEETIIDDTRNILVDENKGLINGSKFARWISVGDEKVCDRCKKWNNRIVCVSGNPYGYPTVEDVIKSGALHINCRCALQELSTDEIPLKNPNPRREERAKVRQDIYNSNRNFTLVFN